MTGSVKTAERVLAAEAGARVGVRVRVAGWVHARRDLGGVSFLVVRDRSGIVQCVFEKWKDPLPTPESVVLVDGVIATAEQAPGGYEVRAAAIEVLHQVPGATPIEVAKEDRALPDTRLDHRALSLRGLEQRAILRIQAALVAGFRDALSSLGFTEIFTPKIVAGNAEGGANVFAIDYFDRPASLTQSPQLYKQVMVGAFERVFETGPVYRAEQHATSRHLNEYLSLDFEMGFIESSEDVMDTETGVLRAMLAAVAERCPAELALLGAGLPEVPARIPRLTLAAVVEIVRDRYGFENRGDDLDPEAERLLSRYALKELGSEWLFVTEWPVSVRPFYAYRSAGGLTDSFDLLFRGLEVTTGGRREHDSARLRARLAERGLPEAAFAGYLEAFDYGLPPHGGLAIGAERLTARLLDLPNIRFARAFPRDRNRLTP
jgi:nondiscriminating aspartyl-tRNA synthetase